MTTMKIQAATVVLLGVCGAVASVSCVRESTFLIENHCANQDGDAWCAERHGGARPFCVLGTCGPTEDRDGCVETEPSAECYSPCGNSMTVDDDASCMTAAGSTSGGMTSSGNGSDSSGESGNESTTGPQPCGGDEDCTDTAAPYCNPLGECVGCDGTDEPNAACAGTDTGLPLCVDGACVACTTENPAVCDEQLLLCDGEANACVACSQHEQCGSGACELAVGRCFSPDVVVHVDGDGGQDFETVAAAVAAVDEGMHGVIVVHGLDGELSYQGLVLVDGGKTIAMLAAPDEAPIIQGTGGNPGVRVEGPATTLYVDGLRVAGNTGGLGMEVDGATAWVDRSRIVQNTGGGVLANNGANVTLRNCFVGHGTSSEHAIEINGATAEILYTTAAVGFDNFADIFAVSCATPMDVTVRNSFLISIDDVGTELSCLGATVSNTAAETMLPGSGNVALGDVALDWFFDLDTGDFRLDNPPAAIQTTARWLEGDPLTDINGTPRPSVSDSPDYGGADVP